MGYRFTPSVDGSITQLGGLWANGVTHRVRLYLQSTGAVIDSVDVTGTGSWAYANLGSSVNVTAGVSYVVAVRLNSQNSGAYSNGPAVSMPFVSGGITVNNSTYLNASDAMPTNSITTTMYGMADITFVPCVYAGNLSAGSTSVIDGDSTTVSSLYNVGSIQWQKSNDGINFTDIIGATGIQISTGAITSKVHYRTRTTSGSCGQDTSNVVTVDKLDPFYPLKGQSPSIAAQNLNWNYNMGYRFTATKGGKITEIGGRWKDGVSHTVRLYSYPSGTVLKTKTISGSMNWAFDTITPIIVNANDQFVVAVRLDGQSSGTYSTGITMPSTSAGVQIDNSLYISNSNAMPTTANTSTMYGMADIRFEPCEYAGLITGSSTVAKWDSTTLTVSDTLGSIQWQKSSDGTTYTNISGATGITINTGGLATTTYFRTVVSNPTCGGDTSNVFEIAVLDPDYPLQAQNPSTSGQNLNWNYNMGYSFTPNSNGNVTELGGRWKSGVSHTVRLYNMAGTVLASAVVVGNGTWNYSSISSLALTKGTQYVVAVRLNSQSSGQYGALPMPVSSGQVTINDSRYISNSDALPTTINTSNMYGMADFKFEPCVYAGDITADDTLICSGGTTKLEVFDAEGTISWLISSDGINYTTIAGATDTVYNTLAQTNIRYYKVRSTAACGSDTSEAASVNIIGGGKTGLWNGLVDNNWNNGCNWASGVVPGTGDSIFIPFGTTPPVGNPAMSISYLELNNTNDFILSNELTISGALKMTSGKISLGSYNLILGSAIVITGGQSTAFIDASGSGEIRKSYTAAGSTITIPVGGNSQYTPITLTLNSGSTVGAGAYLSFRSIDQNHPSLGTPTNRITRYWIVGGVNISTLDYSVTLKYADVDIVGNESSVSARFLNASSQWSTYSVANTSNNTLTASNVTEYGDFTGGDDLPFQSSQNGNWNSILTWSGGVVPGSTDDVTILSGHTVDVSATTNAKSVSINSGGSLNLAGNQLNVTGNFVNYGSFDGTGTVNMSGSSAQQISGTSTFNILRIDNTAGVAVYNGTTNITTRLEIESGNFYTENKLTLISNASKTASIGEIKGSLTGQITAQRHIPSTTTVEWRHIVSPIASSTLEHYLYNASTYPGGILQWGFPGSNVPGFNGNSSYYFSESAAGGSGTWSDGWKPATNINMGNSYDQAFTYYCGGSSYPLYDLASTGNPNMGTITMNNLSMTGSNTSTGWHMIGNPYPSAIDWSSVGLIGVDATAYIFTGGGWLASSLISNEIANSQGFFIRVNNAVNSITFEEADKVNTDAPFRKNRQTYDRIKLSAKNLKTEKSTLSALDIHPNSTSSFDSKYDAYIVGNSGGVPELGFISDSQKLQVSTIPFEKSIEIIPMYFDGNGLGDFEIRLEEFNHIDVCVLLEDMQNGQIVSIVKDTIYRFTSFGVDDSNRFRLILFAPGADISSKDVECYAESNGVISMPNSSFWSPELIDQNGQRIALKKNGKNNEVKTLKAGNYKLVHIDNRKLCPELVNWVRISEPKRIECSFDVQKQQGSNIEYHFINKSKNAQSFLWDFGDGQSSNASSPFHSYAQQGKYEVKIIGYMDDCSGDYSEILSIEPALTRLESFNETEVRIVLRNESLWLKTGVTLSDVTVQVYSIDGKLLVDLNKDKIEVGEVELMNLPTKINTLVIKLTSNEMIKSQKIVR